MDVALVEKRRGGNNTHPFLIGDQMDYQRMLAWWTILIFGLVFWYAIYRAVRTLFF